MKQQTILFSGGGTMGSVTPLLAVYSRLKRRHPKTRFLWVGTRHGPEGPFVRQFGLPFNPIFSGKLRRYFSVRNVIDVWYVLLGFFQSIRLLLRERPALLISAGAYVSVPLHWVGKLLGVRSVILQQDLEIGLSNKLMAPFASRIFVSLPEALNYFSKKTVYR